MKTITKKATITTERGTMVNMTVTATRGFQIVDEELFNDGQNSIVKKGQITKKTEVTLTVSGKDYEGSFIILPAQMQTEKGCYGTFANIALSKIKYDELTAIVDEAKKEAETDQSWIDYSIRKAKADKNENEYYENRKKIENMMTLNGRTW